MPDPRMNFVVKLDERAIARFFLPTDAAFFAEGLSDMLGKPVVVESINQRTTYGKHYIHIDIKAAS